MKTIFVIDEDLESRFSYSLRLRGVKHETSKNGNIVIFECYGNNFQSIIDTALDLGFKEGQKSVERNL